MNADNGLVRSLLRRGMDVNAAQGDGMTALHWAARSNNLEAAKMLLYAGGNVQATTRLSGYTPLILAAEHGHAEMVGVFLDAGAAPGTATSTGAAPLMFAARSGSADAVERLLAAGAEVDAAENHKGQTALMFAAAFDRTEVIDMLLKHGANVAVATKLIDVPALEKKSQAVLRAKLQKQREDRIKALEAEKAGQEKGDNAAAVDDASRRSPVTARDADAKPKQGRNVFKRLFGWMVPRSGEKDNKAPPQRARRVSHGERVGVQGGMTPLLFAARQDHFDSVEALLRAGADVNQASEGSQTSPLLIATMNGHFDLAMHLLDVGADPNVANVPAGVTPLYAAINVWYAPHTSYPQPTAQMQQRTSHLELMAALLERGAEPDVRLKQKIWFSAYNFDQSGINEIGATPFWRAAYGSDVAAMRLLRAYGADPDLRTKKPPARPRVADQRARELKDVSALPEIPVGGPAVAPLHAATGAGYGEGFAANEHRNHPAGFKPAVAYLVDECGADVNARDHEGNTPLHNAAARGDVALIEYLVSKGADVTAVNREGQSTADMANGPVQRIQPFPEARDLLVSLGAKNNNKCISC